jgi:hypothetical protein
MKIPKPNLGQRLFGVALFSAISCSSLLQAQTPTVQILRQYKFDSVLYKDYTTSPNWYPNYLDCGTSGNPINDRRCIQPGAGSTDKYGPAPTNANHYEGLLPLWFKGQTVAPGGVAKQHSGVWASQGYTSNPNALGCGIFAGGAIACDLTQKREYTMCDERARFPVASPNNHLSYQYGQYRYTGFAMKLGRDGNATDAYGFDSRAVGEVVGGVSQNPWAIVFQWRQDGTSINGIYVPCPPIMTGTIAKYGTALWLNIWVRHGHLEMTSATTAKYVTDKETLAFQVQLQRGVWNRFVFATKFATPNWQGSPSGLAPGEVTFWFNGEAQLAYGDGDSATVPDANDYNWNGWIGWNRNGVQSSMFSMGVYRYQSVDKNMTVFYDKLRIARMSNNAGSNNAYYAVDPAYSSW